MTAALLQFARTEVAPGAGALAVKAIPQWRPPGKPGRASAGLWCLNRDLSTTVTDGDTLAMSPEGVARAEVTLFTELVPVAVTIVVAIAVVVAMRPVAKVNANSARTDINADLGRSRQRHCQRCVPAKTSMSFVIAFLLCKVSTLIATAEIDFG
jgi:hypothetical protein